jgi:hypothetical protein
MRGHVALCVAAFGCAPPQADGPSPARASQALEGSALSERDAAYERVVAAKLKLSGARTAPNEQEYVDAIAALDAAPWPTGSPPGAA